jgi:hypothetical protein
MQALQVAAEFGTEHPFERDLLDRDDVHLDLALTKRRCGFERNEACADDYGAGARPRLHGDRPRVGDGAQRVHVRGVEARHGEPVRFGAGRDQKSVERELLSRGATHRVSL